MESIASSVIAKKLEDVFLLLLQRCSNTKGLKRIHALVITLSLSHNNFLAEAIVDICGKSSDIDYANLVFKQMPDPNTFVYNSMIRTYSNNHKHVAAIDFYKKMLQKSDPSKFPNRYTFPFVFKSCLGLFNCYLGKQVHAHFCKFGPEDNISTRNSLIDMYSKFDHQNDAGKVFDEMPERNAISWNCLIYGYLRQGDLEKASSLFDAIPNKTVISWTTIIAGYSQHGWYSQALDMFRKMQLCQLKPDAVTLVAILPACTNLGTLELGKWVHIYASKNGYLRSVHVCNAIIEMYSRCGSLEAAMNVFESIPNPDVISWSTAIFALGNHGKGREAIELFHRMRKQKIVPCTITFLSVLTACAHAGLVHEGEKYFTWMREEYLIEPETEHYCCIVNILGRSGQLDRALRLLNQMPVKPDMAVWTCLLDACWKHRNLDIASAVMKRLEEFDATTSNYILLSNIYADCGRWDDMRDVRKFIKSNRMSKTPGCSVIEVDDKVMEFLSGSKHVLDGYDFCCVLQLLAWDMTNMNNIHD